MKQKRVTLRLALGNVCFPPIADIMHQRQKDRMAIGSKNRRAVLITAAMILVGLNALFFLRLAEEPWIWVVRHPSLESYQRANPSNILSGSDTFDQRMAESSMISPELSRPSMFRDFLACKPRSIMIDEHFGGLRPQMPIRFYLIASENDHAFANCVRSKLPRGYVIERSATGRDKTLPPGGFPPTVEMSATVSLNEQ